MPPPAPVISTRCILFLLCPRVRCPQRVMPHRMERLQPTPRLFILCQARWLRMGRVRADIGPRLVEAPRTDKHHRTSRWLFLLVRHESSKCQHIVNNANARTDNYIAPRASWCYSATFIGNRRLRNRTIGTAVSHLSFAEGQYSSGCGNAGQER